MLLQSLNSQAVEWSLAYKVFSIHGGLKYEWIPLGFLLGALLPCIHWVAKNHIKIIRDAGQNIATPIFCYYLSNLGGGVNSPFTSCMIVALGEERVRRVEPQYTANGIVFVFVLSQSRRSGFESRSQNFLRR